MEKQRIEISEMTLDDDLQPRYNRIPYHADNLANAMKDGDVLPPITVYRITDRDNKLHLVDGWHRLAAHEQLELTEIDCDIQEGTFEEAFCASIRLNVNHAKNLSSAELSTAIRHALEMPSIAKLSVRKIGKLVGASKTHVHRVMDKMKREAQGEPEPPKSKPTKTPARTTPTDEKEQTQVEFLRDQVATLTKQNEELVQQLAKLNAKIDGKPAPAPKPKLTIAAKPTKKHLTYKEVAKLTGLTPEKLLKLANDGKIKQDWDNHAQAYIVRSDSLQSLMN